ncbi:MAG: hypothetical protein AB8G86_19270, partial [Saprospiraceae bacterium]
MKKLVNFLSLAITFLFLTVACQKDDNLVEVSNPETPVTQNASLRTFTNISVDSLGCFLFTYPFDVALTNGQTLTITNIIDLSNNLEEIADFTYPFDLMDAFNNEPLRAENAADIDKFVKACEDKSGLQEAAVNASFRNLVTGSIDSLGCFLFTYP